MKSKSRQKEFRGGLGHGKRGIGVKEKKFAIRGRKK